MKEDGDPSTSGSLDIRSAAVRTVVQAFRSKPAKAVAVLVACVFLLSLCSYAVLFVVGTYSNMKERLAESEHRIKELDEQTEELDEVKEATEDSSESLSSRIEVLEHRVKRLREDLYEATGDDTMIDHVVHSGEDLADLARSASRLKRSESVQPSGVIEFKK